MSDNGGMLKHKGRVFIGYAPHDREVAAQIAESLRSAGLETWYDEWDVGLGDSIAERIDDAMAPADILLVLLSKASANSLWVRTELGAASFARALKDRAIVVVPVLVEDCQIPSALAEWQQLDLRQDRANAIQRLAYQLRAAPALDLPQLTPRTFERLVAELLTDVGFSVAQPDEPRQPAFDFAATYQDRDPFGAARTTRWLVEVKHYGTGRVSVAALDELFAQLLHQPTTTRCLLITNGRLTSVARDFIDEAARKTGREVRVVDGSELTSLLLHRPALVERYSHSRQAEPA